jgi:hypothetical protein
VVFSSAEQGARTVVDGTAPSEGDLVDQLAVALAQADQRTIIVDGDMRWPHEVLTACKPGLSNAARRRPSALSICRTSVELVRPVCWPYR